MDLYDRKGCYIGSVSFNTGDCIYDPHLVTNMVRPEMLSMDFATEDCSNMVEQLKKEKVKYLTISRHGMRNLHYAV